MTGALIGIGFALVVQIGLFAYGYGKLNQKVSDLCGRISRLEDKLNGNG